MVSKRDRAVIAAIRAVCGDDLDKALDAYDRVMASDDPGGAPDPGPQPAPGSGKQPAPGKPPAKTTGPAAGIGPFQVYEIMGYKGQPDLNDLYGIKPLKIWYSGKFWPAGTPRLNSLDFNLPSRRLVEDAGSKSPGMSVIDIEHWPIDDSHWERSVKNYLTVLDWFKAAAPAGHQTGFYSTIPVRDYWRAVSTDSSKYRKWQRQNDLGMNLASGVDVIYPSVYTFYEDRDGWVKYAEAQIAEARRIAPGKPVHAFLWPEYHVSNQEWKGDPIEADYWRLQLETMRAVADGVVIWTLSRTKRIPFTDIPPWWNETVDWIKSI